MSTIAIILAGGQGTRMMNKIPKQFLIINDKPLIVHTLLKFGKSSSIDEVAVVCLKGYQKHLEELVTEYKVPKVKYIIDGGSNRHQSILNALNYLETVGIGKEDVVVVHNANMPMVTEKNINECIEKCKNGIDIVSTAGKCSGFFYLNDNGNWKIGPDREIMFGAKPPEALSFDVACSIYRNPKYQIKQYESYTSGMLGILNGNSIDVVLCESTNIKVTTEDDYRLVSTYLSNEKHNI